jgi:hypothetical protein
VPVAYACNPSYSGDRDQEDCGLKPAWANSSARPYLEKTHFKNRAGGVAQGDGLSSSPSIAKKKKSQCELWVQEDRKFLSLHSCSFLSLSSQDPPLF